MFNKEYILKSGMVIKEPKSKKPLIISIFIILTILSYIITDFSFIQLFSNIDQLFYIFNELLHPNFAYTKTVIPELIATLRIAIVGSFFGSLIAFPVAILAAKNLNNKYVSIIVKIHLSLIRTLPVLIFALLLTYIVGIGEIAGVLALTIFTYGIVSKMLFEYIETIDLSPLEAAKSMGLNKMKSYMVTVIPQITRYFLSVALYSFEINIRSSVVLGYVGAGGVGQLLKDQISLINYNNVGTILFFVLIFVLAIDLFSEYIRRKLL